MAIGAVNRERERERETKIRKSESAGKRKTN